jgi:hypothetical protein
MFRKSAIVRRGSTRFVIHAETMFLPTGSDGRVQIRRAIVLGNDAHHNVVMMTHIFVIPFRTTLENLCSHIVELSDVAQWNTKCR